MSEPSSLYARVRLSPDALQRFMKAPIPPVARFQDWDVIGSHVRSFLDSVRYPGAASNEDWLKQLADRTEASAGWTYDEAKQEFLCHALRLDESVVEYVEVLNALRALSDFKDTPGDDYAVILPFFWTEGIDVACRIGRGSSSLQALEPDTPEFREFLATAEKELRRLAFGDEAWLEGSI